MKQSDIYTKQMQLEGNLLIYFFVCYFTNEFLVTLMEGMLKQIFGTE